MIRKIRVLMATLAVLPLIALASADDDTVAATNFVRQVICGGSQVPTLSWSSGVLVRDEVVIRAFTREIDIPYARFRFVFVDDAPNANWQHPCRYVFLTEDLSEHKVIDGVMMARVYRKADGSRVQLDHPPVPDSVASLDEIQSLVIRHASASSGSSFLRTGDASHSYFVIISGGADPEYNGIRFWADAAMFYSTLTKKYGIPKSHIQTFISDGTNTAADANLYIVESPKLVSSPTDLDGDNIVDVTGPASIDAVSSAFQTLANTLTADDRLFVFITSHGAPVGTASVSNRECAAYLYSESGNAYFFDSDLVDWTEDIACPVAFAIETCYSGGFIDDLMASATDEKPRVIATASNHYEYSYGCGSMLRWGSGGVGNVFATYNFWAAPLISAFRGYNPMLMSNYAFPHEDSGTTVNADDDDNGRVSFAEAAYYANLHDEKRCTYTTHSTNTCGLLEVEHPQYDEYPAGAGASMYFVDPAIGMLTKLTGADGSVSYRLSLTGTNTFTIAESWFTQAGIDISGGVTAALMNVIGANGLPRYQSYLFGLSPESPIAAAQQLKATIGFNDDGTLEVSCSPKRESPLVTYTMLGKSSLDSSDGWTKVTDDNRSQMRFFKVKVSLR